MKSSENMRNMRKMVEKEAGGRGVGGVRTALPKCQLQTIPDYQTCYQLKVEHDIFSPLKDGAFI